MEYSRIINEKPVQVYDDIFIQNNQDKIINGLKVKNWELAPVYKGSFISPKWNGNEYYESASESEIAASILKLVPKIITRLQLRLQMIEACISDADVLSIIDTISDETTKAKILIKWQDATTFDRMDSDLISLWLAMGKTESELNNFFTNASQL